MATRSVDEVLARLAKPAANRAFHGLVYSERRGIDASASTSPLPFHVASIGKVMTATTVIALAEQGHLGLDDPITDYVEPVLLEGLFSCPASSITIRDLLGHTSGMNDYAEGAPKSGPAFLKGALRFPHKEWQPLELLEFTARNQVPLGPRGTFGYSDGGYILLGLVIERVTTTPLSRVLEDIIFTPSAMESTSLMFGHRPRPEIAPAFIGSTDASRGNLLSVDWAGGGVVSTTRDLLAFQRRLWAGEIISRQNVELMARASAKHRSGIYYGLGMMELRFGEFYFPARKLPHLSGHLGILATSMFYDRSNDVHYILNFGASRKMVANIRALIALSTAVQASIPSA